MRATAMRLDVQQYVDYWYTGIPLIHVRRAGSSERRNSLASKVGTMVLRVEKQSWALLFMAM